MVYHDPLATNQKSRLEGWQKSANATQDHLDLISMAIDLATRYGAQSMKPGDSSAKISHKIYHLALKALDSENPKLVPLLRGWFTWLSNATSGSISLPDKVDLPMDFTVEMVVEQINNTNVTHNPNDILKGRKGVDARVIVRGKDNHYNVAKDARVNRKIGAVVTGTPKTGMPFYAAVQLATAGEKIRVHGKYEERAGAQIGISKREDLKEATPPIQTGTVVTGTPQAAVPLTSATQSATPGGYYSASPPFHNTMPVGEELQVPGKYEEHAAVQDARVIVLVMGATGTGKSTFIKQLTGDERVVIGHETRSETSSIQTYSYIDPDSRNSVLLVDTPAFDDSREGMTDTDTLEMIAAFLDDNGGCKLNGILYMHRISDVRIGGLVRKNIRMFEALCGAGGLKNVRIVTTNWDRVRGKEGEDREEDLAGPGGFKNLLHAGAKLVRQNNGMISARSIMSELIPNTPVLTEIAKEMNAGKALGDTKAGRIVREHLMKLQKQHEEELEELRKEMAEAARERDAELQAELLAEEKALRKKIERAAKDEQRLQS